MEAIIKDNAVDEIGGKIPFYAIDKVNNIVVDNVSEIRSSCCRSAINGLENNFKVISGFGSSLGHDPIHFNGKKAILLSQLEIKRIPQLYAAIIPAGCGKSTFCKRTGALDVDELISELLNGELNHMRRLSTVTKVGKPYDWTQHNTLWYTHLRRVLGMLMLDGIPKLVCVHSEECAVMIGALPIVSAALTDDAHADTIYYREELSKKLSIKNLNECKASRVIVPDNYAKMEAKHPADVQEFVALISMAVVPLAFPLQFSATNNISYLRRKYSIFGYDIAVPNKYLTGDISNEDMDEAFNLAGAGAIPKNCFNLAIEKVSGGLPVFGNNIGYQYDWAKLMDEVFFLTKFDGDFMITESMIKSYMNIDWYKYFPPGSIMEEHRVNLHLRDILRYAINHCSIKEIHILLNHHAFLTHYNMMCSILVYYVGMMGNLEPRVKQLLIDSKIFLIKGRQWTSTHKKFHELIRITGHLAGIKLSENDRHALMYTNALYGREVYQLDPMKEIVKRLEDTLPSKQGYAMGEWSTANYVDQFDEALAECYQEMARARPRWVNLHQFWELRASWGTQGSLTLCPKKYKHVLDVFIWIDGVYKSFDTDPQKKGWLETLSSPAQIVDMLYEHAGLNLTRTAPKPDEAGGKERVLLPGSLSHYLAVTYVIGAFDRSCEIGNTGIGSKFGDNHILAFEHFMKHNSWFFMYDFEDHNTQHSLYEMIKTIEYVGVMYKGADPTFPFMIDYIVDSFFKMGVIDKENVVHRIASGLYSGWRNTMWTNVIMSFCYLRVAEKSYYNYYQSRANWQWDVRGDDVVISIPDLASTIKMYAVMNACGYRSQISKQLVAKFSEFLRLSYHKDEVYTCVNRTLPSFVCGEFERTDPSMYERLLGLWMNTELLKRRGFNAQFANHCFDMMVKRWSKLPDGRSVSRVVLHTTKLQNGLGIPDTNGALWRLTTPLKAFNNNSISVIPRYNNATKDYLKQIDDKLRKYNTRLIISNRLIDKLATGSFTTNKIVNQVLLYHSDNGYTDYLTQVGSPVVEFILPSIYYDLGALLDSFSYAGSHQLLQFIKCRNEFDAISSLKEYIEDPSHIDAIMANYPCMHKLDQLEFGTPAAYTVPEYIYSHIRDYVELQVALDYCQNPKECIEQIINAYKIFSKP